MNDKARSSRKRIKLSYIIMVITVVVFTDIPTFYTMAQRMRRETVNNSQAIFRTVAATVDASLEKIDAVILNLIMDGGVERYFDHSMNMDKFTPEDIEQIYRLQKNLMDTVHVNQYIDSIYIYNSENDIILTSSKGVYRSEDFPDNSWMTSTLPVSSGTYVMRTTGMGEQVLSIIRGVPMIGAAKKGYIVVNIPIDILNQFTNTGSVIVLNQEGEVLKATGKEDMKILENIPDTDSGNMKYHGRMISWYASSYSNFKYINIIGSGYIIKYMLGVLPLSILVTLAGLLLVWVIVNYMSRYMYRPIENIIDVIGDKHADRTGEDEFEYIARCIEKFREENRELEANMRLMKSPYKDRVVRSILNNRNYRSEQLRQISDNIGLEIKGELYRVVLIEIDGCERFKQENTESERELWKYGIINIAEEILKREFSCVFSKDNEMAGIINSDVISDARLRPLLTEIRDRIKEYFDISLVIAASDNAVGIEHVNDAYQQALDTIAYKFILGGFSVLLSSDVPPVPAGQAFVPELKTEKLVNAVMLADREIIAKECGDFAQRVIDGGCSYKEIITTAVLQSLRRIESELGGDAEVEYSVYNKLDGAETVYELQDRLIQIFDEMIKSVDRSAKNTDNYADRILSYIDINYKDPDISLKSISDEVGVSVSYVSTIVNAAAKTTLTSYINKRRIEDAKKILVESPGLPIESVREMVGYTNVHSFIRQFKNFEGITPGKYRELHCK